MEGSPTDIELVLLEILRTLESTREEAKREIWIPPEIGEMQGNREQGVRRRDA